MNSLPSATESTGQNSSVGLSAAGEGTLQGWVGFATLACILSTLVSIAAASIFLGVALLLWLVDGRRSGKLKFSAPAFGPWIAAYVGAVLISIVYSLNPTISVVYLLKLVKLTLPFLVFTFMSRAQVLLCLRGIVILATSSALVGIFQFLLWDNISLLNRITGLMSHWMTFAGQLMLVLIAISSYLLFARSSGNAGSRWSRLWHKEGAALYLLGGLICALALTLTYTRNAWLGYLVGAGFLILMKDWRWLGPTLALLVAVFFLLPVGLQQRVRDSFRRDDRTRQGRIELLETGANMVEANPVTGVGPRMVPRSAALFRTRQDFPDWMYIHLHNSPLQIAAEFGLLTLFFWLGLWVYILWSLWSMTRSFPSDPEVRFLAFNGMAAILGFLCAGLLEFNFGDAEVLMLLFFLITAPYVVARDSNAS